MLFRFAYSSPPAPRSSGFYGINKKITKKKELCRSRARQTGSKPYVQVYNPVSKKIKVGNRRLPATVLILLSSVLVDIGRLYCHVSADVLVCRSLVARQHLIPNV